MGMMDFVMSIFGVGGCKMELALDAGQVPVGGILSGKATLVGAAKPYPVNAVKVQLLYVHVESQEDSPLPKIDTRVLVDNTITNNDQIGANARKEYEFTLQIPGGTEPTAHNTSYQVLVSADIPGLKDPTAKQDLKVIEAAEGGSGLDLAGIYRRWPALQGTAEEPLIQAIRDLGWSHSEYDEENNFAIAEPILAKFLRHDSERVRKAALEAWSRVIGEDPTAANVAALGGYLERCDPQGDDILEAIEAAARFGKAGGVALLEPLAAHERAEIRTKIAWAVGLYARDVGKGLMLLEKMERDPDVNVRAEVIEALSNFDENGVVMKRLAASAEDTTTPLPIRRRLPHALRRTWKFRELTWPGIRTLAVDADEEVRRKVADVMSSYTESDGAQQIVEGLLRDADADVRREMAFEICNFPEEAIAPYRPILEALAEADPDKRVRTSSISSLAKGRPADEVATYYRGWMAKDPSEPVLRGIVHGIKFEEAPQYKQLLKELSDCPFPDVAREARDGYAFER